MVDVLTPSSGCLETGIAGLAGEGGCAAVARGVKVSTGIYLEWEREEVAISILRLQ